MLTIVIPTYNELKNQYLQKSLPLIKRLKNIELICVDSYSTDGTFEYISHYADQVIQVETSSRAKRLNMGINLANGEMVLLHHPRSIIEEQGYQYLSENTSKKIWGAFSHKFDTGHPLLKFTSYYSNKIRGDKSHIYYLDHCIFAHKSVLEKAGPIKEVDIFEDTEICIALKKVCPPKRLSFIAVTSAIRFNKDGTWKQALKNQILKVQYHLKANHKAMNKLYEKDINLNADYKDESINE